jgi:hypothetical protein
MKPSKNEVDGKTMQALATVSNQKSKKAKANITQLSPDWIFDSDDELEPTYKPGSLRDEDWTKKEVHHICTVIP